MICHGFQPLSSIEGVYHKMWVIGCAQNSHVTTPMIALKFSFLPWFSRTKIHNKQTNKNNLWIWFFLRAKIFQPLRYKRIWRLSHRFHPVFPSGKSLAMLKIPPSRHPETSKYFLLKAVMWLYCEAWSTGDEVQVIDPQTLACLYFGSTPPPPRMQSWQRNF